MLRLQPDMEDENRQTRDEHGDPPALQAAAKHGDEQPRHVEERGSR
jgi:hypothetical protein